MISTSDIQHLLVSGGTVVGTDGDKIGKIGQLFLDDRTGDPEWVTVTTGLFGRAESFVPLADATVRDDEIVVPYDKAKVKGAPRVEDDGGHLSPDEERELYRYYGLADDETTDAGTVGAGGDVRDRDHDHDDDAGAPGTAAGGDRDERAGTTAGDEDDDGRGGRHAADTPVDAPGSVARDETTAGDAAPAAAPAEGVTTGGARLRRYVVTEEQTITVPVTREELRVEPAPGSDDTADDRH
ncbi:PRC-barrel domain-containing protein [Cellulomonas telluris]|uniref:PRC-barrel domain-containing protein n=1 Tax=Cellulomonas telluris TaxID=2306636 RepID=UPI0010A7F46E|nr:PRC-barrel domain-containing protein [Cellulomonas telluris]